MKQITEQYSLKNKKAELTMLMFNARNIEVRFQKKMLIQFPPQGLQNKQDKKGNHESEFPSSRFSLVKNAVSKMPNNELKCNTYQNYVIDGNMKLLSFQRQKCLLLVLFDLKMKKTLIKD